MTDTNGAVDAAAAAAKAAGPWHAGIDAEVIGFWQNKGLPVDDPKALSTKLTEQYRAAEKHIGAPPDEILRMPKANAAEADVKAFWQRLGVPAEAKEYDFSTIKRADNTDLQPGFADAMRAALHTNFVPKDRAGAIVASVVKALDSADAEKAGAAAAKLTEEKAALLKNWGTNADFHKLTAMQGAKRLGVAPETVAALENSIGYAAVMEMFRKIGGATSEDTFVEGKTPSSGSMTREMAVSRKAELMADSAWQQRFLSGDAAAGTEMRNLDYMIAGIDPAALGRAA